MWYRCEAIGQSNQVHQLQLLQGNANEKLWILWRHVKIKTIQIVHHKSYTMTKMSYFSVFLVELRKTLENNGQGAKYRLVWRNLIFGLNMLFLSKTKMNFWKILIFATHGLKTIFNKCSKFQNDLINILGDMTSLSTILLE